MAMLCGPSCSSGLCVLLPLYSRCPRHRHLHNSPFCPLHSLHLSSSSLASFLPSMAALATHYSSTRCTNRHRHRSSSSSNHTASNHAGSTSSTAPLLPLLPCRRHPHSALPYHPSLASSSKLIRTTKSVCGLSEWLPSGLHVLIERCLTEGVRKMLFR